MASYQDYTVGWITALPLEMAAARMMLDKEHPRLKQPENDDNTYLYGEIAAHMIVIASLPSGNYGAVSAAIVATNMNRTFHNIRYRLMVGIGAGIPSGSIDIRLGDVVVGRPKDDFRGVVQYALGKKISGDFMRTGTLNKPPNALLTALSVYQTDLMGDKLLLSELLSKAILGKRP